MKFLVAVVALLVSGCALLQPDGGASRHMREIVGEAAAAAQAVPEEQQSLLMRAQRLYDAAPNEVHRVRLAALLATLPPPWHDDEKVLSLVGTLAAQRPGSALTELAGMLVAGAAERQRLARELQAAEKRAELAGQRAESAERREESANERANTLQSQVEALKSIERSILEREERRRTMKR